jgi:alkylated DNA repair dioxygenase AlkB
VFEVAGCFLYAERMVTPPIDLQENFVSDPDALLCRLRSHVTWDDRMRSRRTASYGAAYNYSRIAYPDVEMLDDLRPICSRIEETFEFSPNNCLLNEYPNGDATMGFHSDEIDRLETGTGVAILSLGAPRVMVFRLKADRATLHRVELNNGSMLYMPAAMQGDWQHAIPATPGAAERISLSFRLLRCCAVSIAPQAEGRAPTS